MDVLDSTIDDMKKDDKKVKNIDKKYSNIICLGLDIGTGNIALARSDSQEIKITRNAFLPIKKDEINISELSDINYVEIDDDIYIIGEDAFRFANIFSKEISRPMEKGLISPKEINAIDVLTLIIKNLIGDVKGKEVYCSYSIPAESIDESRSVTYHEKVFAKILTSLGINYKSVNEGTSIVYSECEKEKFSGIGISWGAGMCNVSLVWKGIEAAKFSTARSGDYIDRSVAESLNMIVNRVTSIKENNLDLLADVNENPNKKIRRVLEALQFYYETLINYTIKKMVAEFESKIDIEINESLPIVISGGTSLPNGFLEMFKSVMNKYEFPLQISEIRRARNPLTAVANGLLIKTLSDVSSLK